MLFLLSELISLGVILLGAVWIAQSRLPAGDPGLGERDGVDLSWLWLSNPALCRASSECTSRPSF